jgi:hypothetical protein
MGAVDRSLEPIFARHCFAVCRLDLFFQFASGQQSCRDILAFCQHFSNGARDRAVLFTELPELHYSVSGDTRDGYPPTDSAVFISGAVFLVISKGGESGILLRPDAVFHNAGHSHSNDFGSLEPPPIAQTAQNPVISAGKDREMNRLEF